MLKRTPLYDRHVAMGARMVEFGGWHMPVQYSGVMPEHHAVRTSAGLFDISHMGRFSVSGRDSESFLQFVTTSDVSTLGVGQSGYSLLCTMDGGIIDDIFIYRLPSEYLIVVNASNLEKDWNWLRSRSTGFDVDLEDLSQRWAMFALQGPQAEQLFCDAESMRGVGLESLPFHEIALFSFFGFNGMIARTGYTGEDGFEIFCDAAYAPQVWDELLKLGTPGSVLPCGLGARDSLRFEAGLALYGHEITEDTNPYEARLGWTIKLNKPDFIGKNALQQIKATGPTRKLVGFEMVGRGVARADYPIHDLAGNLIGHVTTGLPAPTLDKPLGLGYVPADLSAIGTEFDVMIRGKATRAKVIKTPFYQPRYKR
ncbi:MAG: glycine cleavage system aminomethyltransferase GcvT [Chloroflexaceae bacterium]|nr:glycine cleavage system aminomethyltransferase GcvT [Chloroflexaceae bacterium]